MTWCTAWRGTPQDCIHHMCRAHTVPASIKTANLTIWFPPWTVSREHWSNVLRSSVSGVATDTLLLSRIGVPLVHRYRVFARAGTHVAFCGTYMALLRTFLNVADTACLRSRNRRRTRSLASQMSPEVPVRGRSRAQYVSAQYVSSPVSGIYVGCCCCSGVFDTCRGSFAPVWSPGRLCSARSRVALFRCSGFADGSSSGAVGA